MTICPSCRKSITAPATVSTASNKFVGVGVAVLLVAAGGVGFSLMRQSDKTDAGDATSTSQTAPVASNSTSTSTGATQPNTQNPAPSAAPVATQKLQPVVPQLQAAKVPSFEDTEQEDKCHAFLLDVKRNLTPVIKSIIIQYKFGSRSKCRASAAQAYQIASGLREEYSSLSAPDYMRDAWRGFGDNLERATDDLNDLVRELDGTGGRVPGNSVQTLTEFESNVEKNSDQITLARLKRPR